VLVLTRYVATIPSTVVEDSADLMADTNWAREACAFVIFIRNMVQNFVASEIMLLGCVAVLRYCFVSFSCMFFVLPKLSTLSNLLILCIGLLFTLIQHIGSPVRNG